MVADTSEPNRWIFTLKDHPEYNLTADAIYGQRMSDRFWGLSERTPNRKALQEGDKIVFYMSSPVMAFVGSAVLDSLSYRLSESEREQLSHGEEFYRSEYGVRLRDVSIWQHRRSASDAVSNLQFVENKPSWGAYFQGGIRGIGEADYEVIRGNLSPSRVDQIKETKDLESPSEFALENHLEEFIHNNWSGIDFHAKLRLYEVDGQNGRQFTAGPWSIDFLCIDEQSGEFVIVELKRGKSSDAVMGQVLRYMAWVKENLANEGQGVRGVVIAREADESLKYSVKAVNSVSILTYRVNFSLDSL